MAEQDQHEHAIMYDEQALAICKRLGLTRTQGSFICNLGLSLAAHERPEATIAAFEETQTYVQRLSAPQQVAQVEHVVTSLRAAMRASEKRQDAEDA